MLNVIVTKTREEGFGTAWPCGTPAPDASNLNFSAGQTIPNLVIARIGSGGQVCLKASAPADLIADLAGHFPAGSDFTPLAVPTRVLDTRAGNPTFAVPADGVIELQVSGTPGVPADASAVAANVTVTNPAEAGFITVWPCDAPRPDASNLNYTAGETIPNLVISAVAGNGTVCLYSSVATDLIADVAGFFDADSGYLPLVPARLLDTRGVGVLADSTAQLPVAGRGGVPADAAAVVLNATAVNAQEPGFVTAFPCGTPVPEASNLNYTAGQTIPNLVIVRVGTGGAVCLDSSGAADLLADVAGSFPLGSGFLPAAVPVRLLDTRQIPVPTTVEIVIAGFEFSGPRTVSVGTTVIVRNTDDAQHTWTSVDGAFDSGTIAGGETFSVTLDEPGEYDYVCNIHPSMTGTIVVTE
ncbi:hypothetical protein BH23ACT3_BH23ACT3_16340 [soil metagenome]